MSASQAYLVTFEKFKTLCLLTNVYKRTRWIPKIVTYKQTESFSRAKCHLRRVSDQRVLLVFFLAVARFSQMKNEVLCNGRAATTSCKNNWDTVYYFGLTDLRVILPSSSPYQSCKQYRTMLKTCRNNFEGRGGEGEYYIALTCDKQPFEIRKVAGFFPGVAQHFWIWL